MIVTSFSQWRRWGEGGISDGVRGVVIMTAGFSETGPEGCALEQELVARCRAHGMRVIGSNCMGLYVRRAKLNALGTAFPLPAGPIGPVAETCTLGLYFYARAPLDRLAFT